MSSTESRPFRTDLPTAPAVLPIRAGRWIASRFGVAFGLVVVLVALGGGSAPAAPDDGGAITRPLVVAADTDNFPYSFRDQDDGILKGFAVDMFDAIARQARIDVKRVELAAMDELQHFHAGEFDLGQFHPQISGDDADVIYSFPILVLEGAIFVRKGDSGVTSMADIAARRLSIATPKQGARYAEARGIDPSLITQATGPECLRLLADGKVEAILLSKLSGLAQAQHLGIDNIRYLPAVLDGYRINYCVAAHNDAHGREYIRTINDALGILHQTGEVSHIHQKWFAHYEPASLSGRALALYLGGSLGLALLIAVWALIHQRHLRHRISRQTAELAEGRSILAEAQHFAGLGHWQCRIDDPQAAQWSDETYRIFDLDRTAQPTALTGMAEFAIPGDRSRWKASLVALAGQAQPFDLTVTVEPRAGLRKTVHARGRPVYDAQGRQSGVFGTVQDVTASHAAAEALRRSEQLLRALYTNLPIALGLVDQAGQDWKIVSLNPEARRQLALPDDPPAGTLFSALGLAPPAREFWTRLFTRCIQDSKTIEAEMSGDTGHRTLAVTVFAVAAREGTGRCCFLADDVTDRRRADAELAQGRRLRAIGELVGGIAHEFNNLLTPILLNTQLLQAEWAHERGLRTELEVIADAARRSAELTHRLLGFGRKTERTPTRLDLGEVIGANSNLVRSTIDRRIVVDATIAPGLPPLYLHAADLHQVIINLLLNARDTLIEKLNVAQPPDWSPRIEIDAQLRPGATTTPTDPTQPMPPGGWIDFAVRDNGCGMRPEVVERIFEPFYSTKEIGRGTGLGLATVWHAVSEMGGRIAVESVFGTGTTFHVFIPVHDVPPAVPETGNGPAPAAPRENRRRLLLVEDEQPIARVVRSLLERRGHTVTCAPDGLQGWMVFSAAPERFDAVILDLDMPGISGQEFARRARAQGCAHPIVIVSGRITEADRLMLGELGIEHFVNKPFEPAELYAVLDEALGGNSASP